MGTRSNCLIISGWLLLAAGPAVGQTTLRLVAAPPGTPAGPALFVAGSFNGWQPAAPGYELARQADGSYQLTLPAAVRGPQEFKFTRGSWATGEADAQFRPLANRHADFGAAGPATLTFTVAAWQDQAPGGAGPGAPARRSTRAANVRVLADSFRLPELGGRARRVWLYLPPGYAHGPRRYPVLYLADGQNVFDEATAYAGEWGVDETLNQLSARAKHSGCIVVAVDHGGERRLDEYSPWVNAELKKGGEGSQYTDFLAHTLKPYIDQHYRTRPDAAHTGVAGSSMGGLLVVYAGLKYPRVFGRVGGFSPALWFAKDSLLSYARRRPAPLASRFYFVAGPAESETMLPLLVELRNVLLNNGLLPYQIRFKTPADGRHAEWFWRREFGGAYRWLFGGGEKTRRE